jgi:hypothetical protein
VVPYLTDLTVLEICALSCAVSCAFWFVCQCVSLSAIAAVFFQSRKTCGVQQFQKGRLFVRPDLRAAVCCCVLLRAVCCVLKRACAACSCVLLSVCCVTTAHSTQAHLATPATPATHSNTQQHTAHTAHATRNTRNTCNTRSRQSFFDFCGATTHATHNTRTRATCNKIVLAQQPISVRRGIFVLRAFVCSVLCLVCSCVLCFSVLRSSIPFSGRGGGGAFC